MAHLELNNPLPGIIGLFQFAPDTAAPLQALAQVLLKGPSSLTSGEREIIASYVSYLNDCQFCHRSHKAFASYYLKDKSVLERIISDIDSAPVGEKMRSLLMIAKAVQKSGKAVRREDVEAAKNNGASDKEIHDTVLIAAAFCMFNRYVDGLGTFAPSEDKAYDEMAEMICQFGYVPPKG